FCESVRCHHTGIAARSEQVDREEEALWIRRGKVGERKRRHVRDVERQFAVLRTTASLLRGAVVLRGRRIVGCGLAEDRVIELAEFAARVVAAAAAGIEPR